MNGPLSPVTTYTTEVDTPVVDIVTDPKDWHKVYVLDANGHIWFSPNAGQTKVFDNVGNAGSSNAWKLMTSNLHLQPAPSYCSRLKSRRLLPPQFSLPAGKVVCSAA